MSAILQRHDFRANTMPVPPAWQAAAPRLMAASRSEFLTLGEHAAVVWLVVRGQAQVAAQEGRFKLDAGDWVAFDRESDPGLQVLRSGLVLGVSMPASMVAALGVSAHNSVLTLGRGRLTHRERREALALWRRHGAFAASGEPRERHIRECNAVFAFLAAVQRGALAGVAHCPGHSLRRKRQVFMRMQRAWLRLQGNPDRVLRIQDLARGSNFSLWYFTKVFSAVYGIGPQQFGVQVRLDQACDLLGDPALSINEVASACGFENACSFARAFRGHYQLTATGYRQQLHAAAMPPLAAAVA